MTEKRLKVLLDSEVITKDIYNKSCLIYKKYFNKEDFNEDKVNVFMTHLAMALKRVKENNIIDKLDEDIYRQVKESDVYNQALELNKRLISDLCMDIPKNEEEYFVLHLGNILLERK